MAENLEYQTLGEQGKPLLLLHGLFGSGTNWQGFAKQWSRHYRVLLPDLRNHGNSPHNQDMNYPAMGMDIEALLHREQISQVQVLGHSMGGKVAMWLALQFPQRVERLIVADIAPVTYTHDFSPVIRALQTLDVTKLSRRSAAEKQLATAIPALPVRQFLLQNLVYTKTGYRWRIPLQILADATTEISGFPKVPMGHCYTGDSLFLYGTRSDYVAKKHHARIKALFPNFRLASLEAGHWLHAERPNEFSREIEEFFVSK